MGNCLFLNSFFELVQNSILFFPKLLYSHVSKSLSETLVILLSSLFSISVFCLMVLSLWANKMFWKNSENANQLMLFINYSLPQKCLRIKFYNNRRKKIHFSNVLSTTQLKDRFDSVFSMMPLFNLVVLVHHI